MRHERVTIAAVKNVTIITYSECVSVALVIQHAMRMRCITRVVPKVMSNFFLHANWEQQTKESVVVDGTSCCVILQCLVTSIACVT